MDHGADAIKTVAKLACCSQQWSYFRPGNDQEADGVAEEGWWGGRMGVGAGAGGGGGGWRGGGGANDEQLRRLKKCRSPEELFAPALTNESFSFFLFFLSFFSLHSKGTSALQRKTKRLAVMN